MNNFDEMNVSVFFIISEVFSEGIIYETRLDPKKFLNWYRQTIKKDVIIYLGEL